VANYFVLTPETGSYPDKLPRRKQRGITL